MHTSAFALVLAHLVAPDPTASAEILDAIALSITSRVAEAAPAEPFAITLTWGEDGVRGAGRAGPMVLAWSDGVAVGRSGARTIRCLGPEDTRYEPAIGWIAQEPAEDPRSLAGALVLGEGDLESIDVRGSLWEDAAVPVTHADAHRVCVVDDAGRLSAARIGFRPGAAGTVGVDVEFVRLPQTLPASASVIPAGPR